MICLWLGYYLGTWIFVIVYISHSSLVDANLGVIAYQKHDPLQPTEIEKLLMKYL